MTTAMVVQSFSTYSTVNVSHCTGLETTSLWSPSSTRLSPLHSSHLPSVARKLNLCSPRNCSSVHQRSESISLCTDSEAVDVVELSALLATTLQNCEQFPAVLSDGSIVPVDPIKLRRALRHSTVVVALYVEGRGVRGAESNGGLQEKELDRQAPFARGWLDHWMLQPPGEKTLVAFGRATSDHTLTASIYDLVVAPAYQRLGYGSRVLLKIVRELRRRGVSDIAATPSPELRPFFQSCGFAPDTLKSVTMMYTRSPPGATESWQTKEYGRKFLLIPPPLRVP